MISFKKLVKMAQKWQKFAAMQRKRITLSTGITDGPDSSSSSSSSMVEKGHFVVYSIDGKRFVIPLAYLNNNFFRQLLEMSEEEFGISSDGPIRLPCDGIVLEYIILLIQKGIPGDVAAGRCCSSLVMHQEWRNQQLPVY